MILCRPQILGRRVGGVRRPMAKQVFLSPKLLQLIDWAGVTQQCLM